MPLHSSLGERVIYCLKINKQKKKLAAPGAVLHPRVPVTWEAEAGGLLEARSLRVQYKMYLWQIVNEYFI